MNEQIALGFGDDIDYEIAWDAKVLEELVAQYGIGANELSLDRPIASERDLVISILSFMQSGTGGERWVASSAILEEFARRHVNKITLGGTSVRAAIAMRKLGYTSALHLVTINDDVRRLIPQDSPYVCSNAQDSLHPHLIVQFGQGDCVRAGDIDIRAGRANRIIYHDDKDNIVMRLNEDFGDLITGARVFLLSGFNAMQSEELLVDRLETTRRILARLPAGARVFYEDASFYNPGFQLLVHATVGKRIDIFSLNEDELQAHVGRKLDLLDAVQITAALENLKQLFPIPVLVVHSMYWALAYGENAHGVAKALKGGVTMATTRFRYGDDFTVENYREVENLPPNHAGAAFAGAIERLLPGRVCCVPVPQVGQSNATTIGLGDAFVGGFLPALLP